MSMAKRFRTWLKDFPNEPADRMALALAAVNAYAACRPKYRLITEHLAPLVRAAKSPHKLVYETGCQLLVDLAMTMPHAAAKAAGECILDMARDKSATARLHAVQYLRRALPHKLRLEILTLALQDRSANVRRFAVARALDFDFKGLLPQLAKMQRTERNQVVREELAFCVPLLADGFVVRPMDRSDDYALTVRKRSGAVVSKIIPKDKCSREFVRRAVAQLKTST